MRPGEGAQWEAVDEHQEGTCVGPTEEFTFGAGGGEERGDRAHGQLGDAAGHREAGGAEDVVRRDFQHRARRPGGPQLAFRFHLRDGLAQFGTLLGRQLLGVIGAGKFPQPGRLAVEARVEQHRRGDHRTAERTTARFVDARDARAVGALLAVE